MTAYDLTVDEIAEAMTNATGRRSLPAGLITVADVEPTAIRWLWPGRLPFGKVTILDGDPGLGKSTLLLDLAARGSVGGTTPTGEPLPAFDTVFVTSEDDVADTIRPRFDLANGDPTRLHVRTDLTLPDQADVLEADLADSGARLAIVDPIVAHLDEGVRTASDHQVRRALRPLADVAKRTDAVIVAVRHLNKQAGLSAVYRGGASIGFAALARSVLAVGRDPDDDERFVLASVKINLARRPPSLAYRLVAAGPFAPAKVEWVGPSDHTAESLIGADREGAVGRGKADELAEAMRGVVLANGGRMLARDAYAALEADGFDLSSEDLKTRARRKAAIRSTLGGVGEGWYWEVTP